MLLNLDAWQEKLQGHFAQLAASRSSQNLPVFALEHGLDPADLVQMGGLLKLRFRNGLPPQDHWLLWVVYATEIGYGYNGQEYWISFEEQTPGWIYQDHAPRLANWFRKFQKQFNGVEPSGPWAKQFHRIALPITNAILPKYLQRQFAQAIYELRYRLVHIQLQDAQSAGGLLAESSWNFSTRFQEFLQQEELAGRILLALLQESASDQSAISRTTLDRIVGDLETVREAREWLRATRSHVADRFKGAGRERHSAPRPYQERVTPSESISTLKPKLQLRRDSESAWTPILIVPDLSEIARANAQLSAFLRRTRVRVNGASDSWLPAAWTLGGAKARVLKEWPEECARILSFEEANPVLTGILDGDFRFDRNEKWLFLVSDDGLAREIEGANVRAGERYVLLSREALSNSNPLFQPASISCTGVHALYFDCPEAFSAEDISALRTLNLSVSQSVRIWPSGLSAHAWDGEGYSEWLMTESPCFGIVHDHPVDSYEVQLKGRHVCNLVPPAPGKPVFIQVANLPVGQHRMDVKAIRSGPPAQNRPGEELDGYIDLIVRDPKPWIAGTAAHAGLIVTVDPPQPTLDEFWEGETGLSVLGPEGIQVTCKIELTGKSGTTLLSEVIAAFDLPLQSSIWAEKFHKFVEHDKSVWAFLDAASGRLTIKAEELGNYVLNLERPSSLIRWFSRTSQRSTLIRLLDDSGSETNPDVYFHAFGRPARAIPLTHNTVSSSTPVTDAGGLFFASHNGYVDNLIVSTKHVEGGLQGLIITPDLTDLRNADIGEILDCIDRWEPARSIGPFASQRKDRVLNGLIQELLFKPCGANWIYAERKFNSRSDTEEARRELESAVGLSHGSGFLVVIRRDSDKASSKLSEVVNWFSEVAYRYSICDDNILCGFALALVNQPAGLRTRYKDNFAQLMSDVEANPVLVRSARYLSLLVRSTNSGRAVKWT